MDRSDVINLISVTYEQDEYGVMRESETKRQIYCQVESVAQAEFFEAERAGLNPQFRFLVFFGDYNGEQIVGYKGLRYAVYRTYQRRDDRLELYVERKGGTNGTDEDNG